MRVRCQRVRSVGRRVRSRCVSARAVSARMSSQAYARVRCASFVPSGVSQRRVDLRSHSRQECETHIDMSGLSASERRSCACILTWAFSRARGHVGCASEGLDERVCQGF